MANDEQERSPSPFSELSEEQRVSFLVELRADTLECRDNPTTVDNPFWKYMIAHGNLQTYDSVLDRRPDLEAAEDPGAQEDSRKEKEVETDEDWEEEDDWLHAEDVRERLEQAALAAGVGSEQIEIFGYPTNVFPPTDHHTATYVKDEASGFEYIYIIGGFGTGVENPHEAATLTHRLDLQDYSIRRMETSGEAPPALRRTDTTRTAELDGDRIVFTDKTGKFTLSLVDLRWSKMQ